MCPSKRFLASLTFKKFSILDVGSWLSERWSAFWRHSWPRLSAIRWTGCSNSHSRWLTDECPYSNLILSKPYRFLCWFQSFVFQSCLTVTSQGKSVCDCLAQGASAIGSRRKQTWRGSLAVGFRIGFLKETGEISGGGIWCLLPRQIWQLVRDTSLPVWRLPPLSSSSLRRSAMGPRGAGASVMAVLLPQPVWHQGDVQIPQEKKQTQPQKSFLVHFLVFRLATVASCFYLVCYRRGSALAESNRGFKSSSG